MGLNHHVGVGIVEEGLGDLVAGRHVDEQDELDLAVKVGYCPFTNVQTDLLPRTW